MATKVTQRKQAKIITLDELRTMRYPLPASWKNAIGILKGKNIDPVSYQREIRKEWDRRLKRQIQLAKHGR